MSDSNSHQLLLDALRSRLTIVADRDWYARDAAGHLVALQQASSHLEEIYQANASDFSPQLRHFIERQSYQKAVDYLETAITP